MQKLFFTLYSLFLLSFVVHSQSNLELTVEEADNLFLSQNLNLLAQHYDIEKSEAMLVQAGLFENPTVSYEQIVRDKEMSRYFNTAYQYAVEIEQVLYLTGKRGKQKEIERYNIEIARQEFEMTLRELKYVLHSTLIEAGYARKSIAVFDEEIESLDRLIQVYEEQYRKGNVSLIEKSRLKALFFALKTEQLEYINKLNDMQKQLRLLLNLKSEVTVIPNLGEPMIESIRIGSDFDQLLANHPQLRIAELHIQQEKANLSLQKQLRIPDIAVKGMFDKASNVALNYVGIGIAIGLPIFNRNQGNIKAAAAQLAQNKLNHQYAVNEVTAEFEAKFTNLKLLYSFYAGIDKSLEKNFSDLIAGVNLSFGKQNINMLEFIDYYETYKDTCLKLYENETKLLTGAEEINMLIGNDYIKLWSK